MPNKLTILVPGIRTERWRYLYDSIQLSTTVDWDIIFVGPKKRPSNLNEFNNISWFPDFGSPMRSQQIALTHATGDYIAWMSDDGLFLPGAIDHALSLIDPNNKKSIVCGKYYEGEGPENAAIHEANKYYFLNHHAALRSPHFPNSWHVYMVAFINREYLNELGGWDCNFEACPMAFADLSARAQRDGADSILAPKMIASVGHMPGASGDHGPIYYAQTEHDEPLYRQIYSNPDCVNRIKIDINNWSEAPAQWARRKK